MNETRPAAGPPSLSRRTIVKLAAAGLVGGIVGAGSTAIATRIGRTAKRAYRNFNDAEAALLIAVCERIIPADDAPGATDAGVIRFIDRQLSGAHRRHGAAYRSGLEALRQTWQHLHQRDFPALAPEVQDELLNRLDAGKVPAELWTQPTAPAFFRLVVEHTMQGFYGSPRHGGNRDYLSYRMLGVDYPQILGRNRFKKV